MDGKLTTDTEEIDLGPFADADPAWLRAQILPSIEEYERDPSSARSVDEVFRELKAELHARMK